MIVLLLGSGGREHAMAWKLLQSPRLTELVVAPGNDLMKAGPGFAKKITRWPEGLTHTALAQKAKSYGVQLAVIGPDNPLAEGVTDVLEAHGIPVFGPSAAAAQLESSKAFAKAVMNSAGIPTARYFVERTRESARARLETLSWREGGWVLKADGLALGKGVVVCQKLEQALAALDRLFEIPGNTSLVIEECLVGEEVSWMAFCDGKVSAPLDAARDYKQLLDNNGGPNTGGMGALSPVPGYDARWRERIQREVFEPALSEMARRGSPFKGVLYAGLMIDRAQDRYWVLEFNARFGDPEAQVLMLRLEEDLVEWCEACATGRLHGKIEGQSKSRAWPVFRPESAVVVVAAAHGYPENPRKGDFIAGQWFQQSELSLPAAKMGIFPAGIKENEGAYFTSGGRVLGAAALGASLEEAREGAYRRLKGVMFEGMQFRQDIARGLG